MSSNTLIGTKQQQRAIKYRPSLTAEQILKIIELAKLEAPISNTSIQLVSILSSIVAKIENGALVASYVPAPPKPSLLESLGGPTTPSSTASLSKEQQWELAYNKYSATPLACTATEILEAKEHMYLNDLMSAEEIAEFEKAMFLAAAKDSNT